MTKAEFQAAFAIADNSEIDLTDVDDSVLFGCGLPGFKPVAITLEAAAKHIRWQCGNIFYKDGGKWDSEALNECHNILRHTARIVQTVV